LSRWLLGFPVWTFARATKVGFAGVGLRPDRGDRPVASVAKMLFPRAIKAAFDDSLTVSVHSPKRWVDVSATVLAPRAVELFVVGGGGFGG
jgi:hypothetical protein